MSEPPADERVVNSPTAAPSSEGRSELGFWRKQGTLFMARGLKPTLVLFDVQIAAMLFVSATPFLPGEQQLFTQLLKLMEVQITGLPPSLLVLYVFGHNLVVAALESVPLLGPLVFAASTCNGQGH